MSNPADLPLSVPAAIDKRRSVRHFEPDPISDELLQQILELSVKAPTSWNLQPVRMVVVRDAEKRAKLHEACFYQPQVKEAPVSVVFAIEIGSWRTNMDEVIDIAMASGAWTAEYVENYRKFATGSQESLGEALREYDTKDALITATHLALAAESLGLGSCFMNGYVEDKVKAVIGAADRDDIGISLVMPIGTPSQSGGNPGRLPLSKTVFADSFDTPWSSD